jgi:RimJ/RimL family protein N-acetyltransferase
LGKSGKVRVRLARVDDEAALARFRCSTGPWFEEEVERHVREDALQRALDEEAQYRLLLFEDGERLWAVGAHQPEELEMTSGDTWLATRLVVLAVDLDHQGARLGDRLTFSQAALDSLISDAVRHWDVGTVSALVARDNIRSQRLCRRCGLVFETRENLHYLRMTGRFAADG